MSATTSFLRQGAVPSQQKGVTLVVALILLLVVSLIGVSAMRATTMEEKMASNTQDQSLAFQAAEAAIKAAVGNIDDAISAGFTAACVSGYCTASDGSNAAGRWEDSTLDVWGDTSKHQTLSGLDGVASQPAYIIEKLEHSVAGTSPSLVIGYGQQSGPPQNYYRITARGTGGTDTAVVMLQALYVQ